MTTQQAAFDLAREVHRLRAALRLIVWHAVGQKPGHTAPAGNRLQMIYCTAQEVLGEEATEAAAAGPEGLDTVK